MALLAVGAVGSSRSSTRSGYAAHLVLAVKEPERFSGRRLVRDAVIAAVGFGYSIWAMYATGSEAIAKGYLLLIAGVPVYVIMTRRAKRQPYKLAPREPVSIPPAEREPIRVMAGR